MSRLNWIGMALAVGVAACGHDAQTLENGDVSLQWAVGPRGCEEAGTSQVVITTNVDVAAVPDTGWRADCDARSTVLTDLPPGVYEFHIAAVSPTGEEWYAGDTGEVQVRPGGLTTTPPVVLQSEPADYLVKWTFGGPLCAHVGVSSVHVMAFDAFGTIEEHAQDACDAGQVSLVIRPGDYDVVVHALSPEGTLQFEAVYQVDLGRGESRSDQVELINALAP